MKRYIAKSLSLLLAGTALLALMLSSCTQELDVPGYEYVPEGEPAVVSLTITVPDMPAVTRDAGIDPDSESARTVQDLWIGFYSTTTGARIGRGHYIGLNATDHHVRHTINNISTLSGVYKIVAVANVALNEGIVTGEDKATNLRELLEGNAASTFDGFKKISMVMGSSDAVVRTSPTLVMCGTYSEKYGTGNPLPKHDNNDDDLNVSIYPGNNQKLTGAIHLRRLDSYITFNLSPATNVTVTPISWQVCNLPGISYLFEQNENGKGKNAADQAIASGSALWTKDNASYYHNSQVFGANMFTPLRDNSGTLTGSYSFDFYQMENKHTGIITSQDATSGTDLYNLYNLREREFKQQLVSEGENGTESTKELNTGWYRSLVEHEGTPVPAQPTSDPELINNNASYVVIRARVEYYYRRNDENCTPVAVPTNGPIPDDYVYRVGDAIYTIHLGFCDGDGLAKANDFNCYRNTKYTYNITIEGVDNIRVEAQKDELQSGAEGTVTDLISTLFNLDSHYGVINIALTDEEREALYWRIQAPFDNQVIDMVGYAAGAQKDVFKGANIIDVTEAPYKSGLPKNQFYNWIQIRPTSGEKVIAEYPGDPRLIGRVISNVDNQAGDNHKTYPLNYIEPNPYWDENEQKIMGIFPAGYGESSAKETPAKEEEEPRTYTDTIGRGDDKGVWYLEQLCDPEHFPHPDATKDKDTKKKRWYTIFIDEYVYEYEYDAKAPSLTKEYGEVPSKYVPDLDVSETMDIDKWRTFANQDSRHFWLGIGNMDVSTDTESIYSNSIYLITQESIQTYYGDNAEDGIGLEHTNESYMGAVGDNAIVGNLNWTFEEYNGSKYDPIDGLLNMYYFVTRNTFYYYPFIKNVTPLPGYKASWAQISETADRVSWADIRQTGRNVKTTKFREGISRQKGVVGPSNNLTLGENPYTYYIPDHPNSYMMACLARNRDLNHDDIVGANEIRWYLPTAAVYTRMVLGSVSLRTPIFNLVEYSQNEIVASEGHPSSHYATSDRGYLWAEELASVDLTNILTLNKSVSGTNGYPARTIRCVRNLGQDMNVLPSEESGQKEEDYKLINAAYERREGTNIVDMKYYHSVALRPATSGIILPHHAGDIMSYPSRSFKFASKNTDISVTYANNMNSGNGTWYNAINTVCNGFIDGETGWRVPNISEINILLYLDAAGSDEQILNYTGRCYLSCTFEYFAGQGYRILKARAATAENNRFSTASAPEAFYVRCVKDVE